MNTDWDRTSCIEKGGNNTGPLNDFYLQRLTSNCLRFFFFFLQLDWKRSLPLKEHMGQNSYNSLLELKCCESSCSKITYFFINHFHLFSVVVNKSNFWDALFLTGISMVFNFLMTLSQRANWVLYIKYLVKNLLTYCKYKYSWLVIDPSIYFW